MSNDLEIDQSLEMEKSELRELRVTEDNVSYSDFACAEGSDTILLSSDDVKFHTHTFVLKNASGIFRTTLSLPRAAGTLPQDAIIGPLQEDAQTIDTILRMISGMVLPALDTFEIVEKALIAADKWDMPGPISIIQRIVMSPALSDNPLRLYILACRFRWTEAAKVASTRSLDLDFRQEDVRELLHKMESRDLLDLQDLRTRRRDAFLQFLEMYSARSCVHNLRGYNNREFDELPARWEALKLKCFKAMDHRPSGGSLFDPHSGIEPDLKLLSINCPECSITRAVYDVKELRTAMQLKLAELPQSI